MTLSIRNREADRLARQLADMEQTTITDAVVIALKDAVRIRTKRVDPIESGQMILAKYGLSFPADRRPVPDSVYREYDHDLLGEDD